MRLSGAVSFAQRRKGQKLGNSRVKKKHKRLDAICERLYNENHRTVGGESSHSYVVSEEAGIESELRRSTRVRRAPVVLDASPSPSKKRRKTDKKSGFGSAGRVERVHDGDKTDMPCSSSRGLDEEQGSWRSRLRSRRKIMRFGVRGKNIASPRSKRLLFEGFDGFKASKLAGGDLSENKLGVEGVQSTVVRSKRPGRIKASNTAMDVHPEIQEDGLTEGDKEKNEVEVLQSEDASQSTGDLGYASDSKLKDGKTAEEVVENGESCVQNILSLSECPLNCIMEPIEPDKLAEEQGCDETKNQNDAANVNEVLTDSANKEFISDKPLGDDIVMKEAKRFTDGWDKPRIKEGRRCGLCGGGTDGKPPKVLVQDGAGSDNEAYSGSSTSEEPNYDIWDGFGDEPGWLGRLLGPINDRFGIAGIWVHQHCAVWSPEVYFAGLGHLKNIRAALCRGRVLKCTRCGRRGATIGCRVDRCPRTYHLPCARTSGCIFDHRKFLIACTDHSHIFQPHGSMSLRRLKKLKARKIKLELKKLSYDAWRKDLEAEEKWLEICGEDEEFLKRERKRLQRDLLRIAPVYIGGSETGNDAQFQGWESVAGLRNVIQCMKEVVILPLLYPELFNNFGLSPPRGVLLHGYPGTGKTLVVRALIGSCARGDKRIAYFARKGADCLGKYVGDAERQLRLLFQVAEKSQPSIIFFDEIDGLAPCRTRQQDQTHNSVVSTLLALLDGLKSRGSVVVIGATNRPDAVDPALRRPGRFDREIYFPLPTASDREAILSLHTKKWPKPIGGPFLKWIAKRTVGFAGADLQALCTQAAIIALKRSCPLKELLSNPDLKRSSLPTFTVEESDWLEALSGAPPPCSRREAGAAANDTVFTPLPAYLASCLLQPLSKLLISLHQDGRLQLPSPVSKAACIIKSILVATLDKKKMPSDTWWVYIDGLLQQVDVMNEIETKLMVTGNLIGDSTTYVGLEALDNDTDDSIIKGQNNYSLQRISSFASGKKPGFRILISGDHRSGQRHLASCLLNCFVGTVKVQKIDLATMSQQGHGDVVQGLTQLLIGCACVGSCMIFMPRFELWAIDTSYSADSKESDSSLEIIERGISAPTVCRSMEMTGTQHAAMNATSIWNLFIEQVETITVSSPLMILATSEVPFLALPSRIRQFFNTELLDCTLPGSTKDTVPRFSVQVGGNINRDLIIKSSADKLAKNLAHRFIQMIHHRMHAQAVCSQDKASNNVECESGALGPSIDPASSIEEGSKECPVNPLVSVPFPLNNKVFKGKSSLPLAISTFGYQILKYPHFAELCWFTSKLKEGPAVDINVPLKDWSFNSCIVRPNIQLENVAVNCSSSNTKCKEHSELVRGLVAVGLLAYRGLYTSLREVSLEVQKVLDLLADQINAKIQAGRDRYQYYWLFSQMAYLEDVVNSWVYTLRSLEVDCHPTLVDLKTACVESAVNCNSCEGSEKKLEESSKGLLELEAIEKIPGISDNNITSIVEDGDFGNQNANADGIVSVAHAEFSSLPGHTTVADSLDDKFLNRQNLVDSKPTSKDFRCDGDVQPHSYSNVLACNDFTILQEEDRSISADLGDGSGYQEDLNQGNGLPSSTVSFSCEDGSNSDGHNVDTYLTSNGTTSVSADSNSVCSYKCCTQCLSNLEFMVRQILIHEWESRESDLMVDDVHEIVSSLSAKLHSTVGTSCLDETMTLTNSFNTRLAEGSSKWWFERHSAGKCIGSENSLISPIDCICHSASNRVAAKASSSSHPQRGFELETIFKNGIPATLDQDKDIFFHCKFETLCLCSFTQFIVMKMQPLD